MDGMVDEKPDRGAVKPVARLGEWLKALRFYQSVGRLPAFSTSLIQYVFA